MQPLTVLVGDEMAGEIERGQRPRAVLRIGDTRMMESRDEVADAELTLNGSRESHASSTVDPVRRQLVAVMNARARPIDRQGAERAGDVAHVTASDQIAAVADAVSMNSARGEQEARHLEASRRQHHIGSGDRKTSTVQCPDDDALDATAVGRQVDLGAIGVEQHPHVATGPEPMPISSGEIGGAAEALERIGRYPVAGKTFDDRAHTLRERRADRVCELARLAQLVGAEVVGQQGLVTEGPTARRHVGSLLEVDRIERHTAPTPNRRRSAEPALAISMERTMPRLVDNLALVERLRRLVARRCPRLDHEYRTFLPQEFEREGDAGRTPADDAYIRVERGSVFDQLRVVDHPTPPGRAGHRSDAQG